MNSSEVILTFKNRTIEIIIRNSKIVIRKLYSNVIKNTRKSK